MRSAARLIHAELTENTASIRYFRKLGSWPTTRVRHTAWDAYAETLSRMRRAESFQTIQRGYSQLDGIVYLATTGAEGEEPLPASVVDEILEVAIGEIARALQEAGALAGIDAEALRDQTDAMMSPALPEANGGARVAPLALVPPSVQDAIARVGTDSQRDAARSTLETMQALETAPAKAVVGTPDRKVYDAGGSGSLHDIPIARAEGDPPTSDPAVDEGYDCLGAFYDFFAAIFGRDSIDGRGQPLELVVHYEKNFTNTFWIGGEDRLVAGDGDGEQFVRPTKAVELIARGLSFGVVNHDARLLYQGQSGALVDSLSCVFGVLVKQHKLGQAVEQADWLLGADALGPKSSLRAFTSMAAPGTAYDGDPQPAHMKDYVKTEQDQGGIHINSGIPNHAFYRVATALGGFAWERAGRVWYEAMRDPGVSGKAGFRRFARATVEAAARLYGESSEEVEGVRTGWGAVGVKPSQPKARL